MELEYLDLLHHVLENGDDRTDRTGVGTRSIFGTTIRCDLQEGFPLLTTKAIPWKSMAAELLWFIEGSSDERRLAELTHGTRDPAKKTIWTANANATYWEPKANFKGDLGRIYGVQWRKWQSFQLRGGSDSLSHPEGGTTFYGAKVLIQEHDQLQKIIDTIRTNPSDRRMVMSAFNPGELDQMALPPCHMFAQFHVGQRKGVINCQVYIRSNDLFLGLPFNIASYALLTEMIASITGYRAGELIINIGDAHIYKNHFRQCREQLSREPGSIPRVVLNSAITEIDDFKMSDIDVVGYDPQPAIKAEMAV